MRYYSYNSEKRKYETFSQKEIKDYMNRAETEAEAQWNQSVEETQEGLDLFNHLKDEHLIGDDNGKGKRTESSE